MKNIVDNIESKVLRLIENYKSLNNSKLMLEEENNILSEKLELRNKEIITLKEKIKLMNISKSVDSSNNELKETRLKINEYVREIDKCIGLLNK